MLCNVSLTLSKYILDVHPRADSGISRGSSNGQIHIYFVQYNSTYFLLYRKQLVELRASFNQLVGDYKDLLDTFDDYKAHQQTQVLHFPILVNPYPAKIFIHRRSRRDIVLASSVRPSVRPSIPSVRPHFLSVRNHISVPIGQI